MLLDRIWKKINYKGAGVLFTAQGGDGERRVLLGQRRYKPYAGYWAIPGGGMEERDDGDFRACAAREAWEETVNVPALRELRDRFERRLAGAAEHRVRIPGVMTFRTFLLPLATMPDLRIWPYVGCWNSEFDRFGWFETGALPRPLHPFLGRTLELLLPRA